MLSIAEANALDRTAFLAHFSDLAEHSPWVAEEAERRRPFAGRDHMGETFAAVLRDADEERRLALLRAHPDLAGKAALAGALAQASRREQAGAGLDRLSAPELERFADLNARYRERFGFPFILAVKGLDAAAILAACEVRLARSPQQEAAEALEQVARIVDLRIEERVAP